MEGTHKIDWSLVVVLSVVITCATVLAAVGKLQVESVVPVFSGALTGIFALAMPRQIVQQPPAAPVAPASKEEKS